MCSVSKCKIILQSTILTYFKIKHYNFGTFVLELIITTGKNKMVIKSNRNEFYDILKANTELLMIYRIHQQQGSVI